jgi:hypothetical protein
MNAPPRRRLSRTHRTANDGSPLQPVQNQSEAWMTVIEEVTVTGPRLALPEGARSPTKEVIVEARQKQIKNEKSAKQRNEQKRDG